MGSRLQALGGGCWAQGRIQCPDNAGFQSRESGVLHVWGPSVGKQTKEEGAGLQPGADQLNTLMACSRGTELWCTVQRPSGGLMLAWQDTTLPLARSPETQRARTTGHHSVPGLLSTTGPPDCSHMSVPGLRATSLRLWSADCREPLWLCSAVCREPLWLWSAVCRETLWLWPAVCRGPLRPWSQPAFVGPTIQQQGTLLALVCSMQGTTLALVSW